MSGTTYGSTAPYGQLGYKGQLGGGNTDAASASGLELYPDCIYMGNSGFGSDGAFVVDPPVVHSVNDTVAAGLWPERCL